MILPFQSVFGSFKNYLSGKTGETTTMNRSNIESPASNSSRTLLEAVDQTKPFAASSTQDHPGTVVLTQFCLSTLGRFHD